MYKKWLTGIVALSFSVILVACGGNDENMNNNSIGNDNDMTVENNENDEANNNNDDMDMDPSSSGEVPDGLQEAEEMIFPVGSEAVIKADHMPGMERATATIDGAYDTTAYIVTYTPTNGGEKVEEHKWVIHEELEDPQDNPYQHGDEVVLEADHMEGMEGASATIDEAIDTVVYMVSYKDTDTGEEVKYHKWVTEEELELDESVENEE